MEQLAHMLRSPLARRLLTGAFWITAGTVLSRVGALLAWIPVARLVGDQRFGEIALLQSTITLFAILGGDALGTTAMKYVAEHRETSPERAGRILVLSGVLSVCTALLMAGLTAAFSVWLASYTFRAPHLAAPLAISCLAIFFTTLNGAQLGALAGLEAFRELAINSAASSLVSAPLLVLGAWLGGVTGVVWGLVAVPVITWFLNHRSLRVCTARRGIPLSFSGCLGEWPVLVAFSLPAVLAGVVGPPVNWIANTLLVRQADGYAEMGLFNAANQWRSAVLYLTGILASLTLPILANLRGRGELARYRKLFFANVAAVFLTSTAAVLPLALLAPSIMSWYGPEFAHGWPVLVRVLVVAVLFAVQGALGQLLSSSGRMWQAFALSAVWATALLAATWSWRERGALGLADAQLVAFGIYAAMTGFCCWRELRQTPPAAPDPAPASPILRRARAARAQTGAGVAVCAGLVWGFASFGAWIWPMPAPGVFHILGCVLAGVMLLLLFLPAQPGVRLHNTHVAVLLLCLWAAVGVGAALLRQKEPNSIIALAYLCREPFVILSLPALFRLIQSGWANVDRFVLGLLICAEGVLLGAIIHRPSEVLESDMARLGDAVGLNANSVGFFSATVATIALSQLLEQPLSRSRRGFNVLLLATAAVAIVLSKSRTSMVCLALGALYVLYRAPGTTRKLVVCGAIALAACAYSETLLKASRWHTTIGQDDSTTPLAGREELFQEGLGQFLRYPLFGSGFSEAHFHSGYLDAAAKTGLVGLGSILVLLILATVRSFYSRVPIHWPHAMLYMGLVQALVEPRILSYGSVPAVAFTFSLVLFLSQDLPTPYRGASSDEFRVLAGHAQLPPVVVPPGSR